MKSTSHMQCKRKNGHFWQLMNISNRQDKLFLQMTTAFLVHTAAKNRPVGFGCDYFTLVVPAVEV